ncbi:transcription-repair coupling factor [Desulfosoma caldarium]|nr:transcription-repair coupling factor [Desulfosoma caldarium]
MDKEQAKIYRHGLSLSAALLSEFVRKGLNPLSLSQMPSSALALWVGHLVEVVKRPVVVIASSDREAGFLADEIRFFLQSHRSADPLQRKLLVFPSRCGHQAQVLGKMESTAQRVGTLWSLKNLAGPYVVVTSAAAILEKVIPPEVLMGSSEYRVVGETLDVEGLVRRLVAGGYYPAALVEEYGDFSRRGGVLDVYVPLYAWPVRLEFSADVLESIRLFHPASQRSVATLEEVVLVPASEVVLSDMVRQRARRLLMEDVHAGRLSPSLGNLWRERLETEHQPSAFETVLSVFYEELASLFDYLPQTAVVLWSDYAELKKTLHETYGRILWEWGRKDEQDLWRRPVEELFLAPESVDGLVRRFQNVWINAMADRKEAAAHWDVGVRSQSDLCLALKSHPKRERLLEPVVHQVRSWQDQGLCTVIVSDHPEQSKRLKELLTHYGVETAGTLRGRDLVRPRRPEGRELYLAVGPIRTGFVWPGHHVAVVSETELFGRRRARSSRKRSLSGLFLSSFEDLRDGDLVVHVDHGIAVYRGLVHLTVGQMESDFLQLDYQDGDRLYVPVDKLHKVQKYLGLDGTEVRLDKLGGKTWEAAKRKARESAERVAEELLKIYALRHIREGTAFSPPDNVFREFEATFAFEETPDQMRAIEDVLQDMCSPRPMDRLICGDVGYGKTEVALRAAFKAAMDGKQVAMLTPTTVLAEQHFATFQERLKDFPVTVDVLSRFRTPAEQKRILERLQSGSLDIIIGTHRLLQKDVVFKDLGLLIIDEEQRFGVRHKERIKEMRVAVDVLTLTATPIPRTLHMALSGIRDLSTIETAPQDRKAVETVVCPFEDLTIREAITRELRRGGQVFFVHNHVQTILRMADKIRSLVPEARVEVAHGQMKERDLEKIMLDFVHRKVDVLVCTTIIESGLDIPTANTILINRADKMGLAQIYQLRGRVGRSAEQAYAYLLIPGEHLVTRDAQKRLRALMDFSELGSGFKIALNDLQIRGGGTILGSAQSGHIASVGYELYLELLEETIRKMKGEAVEEDFPDPEIALPIAAYLPTPFMPVADQRLVAYKRLSGAKTQQEIDDIAKEWRDRCGPLPDEAKSLLLLARLRLLMKALRITRLEGTGTLFTFTFMEMPRLDSIMESLCDAKCSITMQGERKMNVDLDVRTPLAALVRLKRILQALVDHGKDHSQFNRLVPTFPVERDLSAGVRGASSSDQKGRGAR